ncbi:MAG: cation:proton antiporter [Hyphomicrobiaceae bacterium]|nr:cation:proton antiporter [Hyphomicrobiaceae bacterium]
MIVDIKVLLFLQVVLVVGLPLLLWGPLKLGRVFPLPIIQILAGIVLGPSVFGALAPEAFSFFFRKDFLAGVDTLANVALVLFVFLAGCELDKQILSRAAGMVLRAGIFGVAVPWIAGGLAAWGLLAFYAAPGLIGAAANQPLYAVAFGLCMAVTALPVLVVILRELGFNQRPIGTIALAIGGIDDALLWSSLTVLLPFAAGKADPAIACSIAIGGAILTVLALHFVVSPALQHLLDRQAPERFLVSLAIIVLFASAALNEATQLHAAIGAFLTGLLLPDKVRELCEERFDAPVTLLLLPFLFLATGLKTTFSVTDPSVWIVVLVAMVVCVGGKFVGITLPVRGSGESWPFAVTLGVLMQCKGLMEIVVVTVLYQKGIFGDATFSALVLVALISTAITVPMARACHKAFGDAATQSREEAPVTISAGAPSSAAPARGPVLMFADREEAVPLSKPEVVIGRHSSDDIRINDIRLSRHHARLVAVDGGYEIHNLTAVRSEPNPMSINGVEKEHALLQDGDRVSLGGIEFTFRK